MSANPTRKKHQAGRHQEPYKAGRGLASTSGALSSIALPLFVDCGACLIALPDFEPTLRAREVQKSTAVSFTPRTSIGKYFLTRFAARSTGSALVPTRQTHNARDPRGRLGTLPGQNCRTEVTRKVRAANSTPTPRAFGKFGLQGSSVSLTHGCAFVREIYETATYRTRGMSTCLPR